MTDPKQFLRDPATGELVEGRWVCPSCKLVNVGPRCGEPSCGYDRGALEHWNEPLLTMDDDTGEFPALVVDPPGGSD